MATLIKIGKSKELTVEEGQGYLLDNGCCYQLIVTQNNKEIAHGISEREFLRIKKEVQNYKIKGTIRVDSSKNIKIYL